MEVLQRELDKVEKEKDEFVCDFSEVILVLHNHITFFNVFLLFLHPKHHSPKY